MNTISLISIIIIAALLFERIMNYFKLPSIIGYLIAGIIIGPYALNFITISEVNSLQIISSIALTFISFSIGTELRYKVLKKLGIKPFIIALICAIVTDLLITLGLILIGTSIPLALILGSIGAATAPAIIMIVIKEYKAEGKLTNTLLSIVAIDDVISIVLFGFSLVIAKNIFNNTTSFIDFLLPFKEIIISIIIGSIFGFLLGFLTKKFKNDNSITCIIILFIFSLIYITDLINISPLLISMISGFVFINVYNKKITDKVLKLTDYITPLIMIILFVTSGANLNLRLLSDIGLIGFAYIILRIIGKITGSIIGIKIVNEKSKDLMYLGPMLFSQTGLSIGLVIMAVNEIPSLSNSLTTIILGSSLIFDIISPLLVKNILIKTKNIKQIVEQ